MRLLALVLALIATPALATPAKIHIACTAAPDCASAMIAAHDGIFAAQAKFTKLSGDFIKKFPRSVSKPDDFSWRLAAMKQPGMLQDYVDKAKLVLP